MNIRIELSYMELCKNFDVQPLFHRREISDLTFLNKVFNDKVDCSPIIGCVYFYAPQRPLRHGRRALFSISSRINVRKNSPMLRAQRLANENPELDVFIDVPIFKRNAKRHYSSLF